MFNSIFITKKYLIGNFSFQASIVHDELKNLLNFNFLINKIFLITKYVIISAIKYKLVILNVISIIFALIYFINLKNILRFIYNNLNYKLIFVICYLFAYAS